MKRRTSCKRLVRGPHDFFFLDVLMNVNVVNVNVSVNVVNVLVDVLVNVVVNVVKLFCTLFPISPTHQKNLQDSRSRK